LKYNSLQKDLNISFENHSMVLRCKYYVCMYYVYREVRIYECACVCVRVCIYVQNMYVRTMYVCMYYVRMYVRNSSAQTVIRYLIVV